MTGLQDKVVIIIGAGGGLGRAVMAWRRRGDIPAATRIDASGRMQYARTARTACGSAR